MNIPIDLINEISSYIDNKSFINLISTNKLFYYHKYLIKKRKQREKGYHEYQNELMTIWGFLKDMHVYRY